MDLKIKSKGFPVELLQKNLKNAGFDPGKLDGDFGEKTQKAVKDFQNTNKLKVDGIVGLKTAIGLGMEETILVKEIERLQFQMLLMANPNYFGNLTDSKFTPVAKMICNTGYEDIACVGFNPKLEMLESTIYIKRPYGYGGNLCSDGTMEYVRFYLDYGQGWEDAGLTAFKAHNVPDALDCSGKSDKPLSFVCTLPISPAHKYCFMPVMPKVRAILSWQAEPPEDQPEWKPVWGNVVDKNILIDPRKLMLIDKYGKIMSAEVLEAGKLPLTEEFKKVIKEPAGSGYENLELKADLVESYKKTVESHRFGFNELHGEMVSGMVNADSVNLKMAKWKELGLDWPEAVEKFKTLCCNVNFEELSCLGLDINRDWLEATVIIKKPLGYLGDLCSAGSREYVAFWADWEDTCQWSYLGTAHVNVHDISNIPDGGLHYSVILPVSLDEYRKNCKTPAIGRIRAVLSWNTPPSTSNPNAIPYYGNRVDSHILISPAEDTGTVKISILGGVGVADIDTTSNGRTKPYATMTPWGGFADQWGDHGRECPFGGSIILKAPRPFDPGFTKYRVWVRRVGEATETLVTNKIWVVDVDGVGSFRHADSEGFFNYLDVSQNVENTLARWVTGEDDDGLWEIWLEAAGVSVIENSQIYRIRIDNTKPDVSITIDGGACDQYAPGTVVTGKFVARDPNFGRFHLYTEPLSMAPPHPVTGTPPSSSGLVQTSLAGENWSLDTSSMVKCGYVVVVRAWDRTIVNSKPGSHNFNRDDKGFCLL